MREIFLVEKTDNVVTKEVALSGENLSDMYYSVLRAEKDRQKKYPHGGYAECLPELVEKLTSLNLVELIPEEY